MFVRIVHFLLGAVLAGGGGFLAWTNRSGGMSIFPPAAGMPWLVIAGVMGLSAGAVLLMSAVHPRPNRAARLAKQAAEQDATLGAAEAYYSERGRAADRDWRAGDIPAPVAPAPVAEPVRAVESLLPPEQPPPPASAKTTPVAAPLATIAAKPVATSAPPQPLAPTPFPSAATLAPIPAAAEPPPAPEKSKVEEPVAPVPATPAPAEPQPDAPPQVEPPVAALTVVEPVAAGSFPAIRAALAAGKLEDAEKLLNAGREMAQGLELAELTGLAGDHAAALGRLSNAKWLWRLALKRFGEFGAMDTPAAKAVAESLRVTG